jgi:hypothetical protein
METDYKFSRHLFLKKIPFPVVLPHFAINQVNKRKEALGIMSTLMFQSIYELILWLFTFLMIKFMFFIAQHISFVNESATAACRRS